MNLAQETMRMTRVERAIQLALTAHAGQVDKGGDVAVLHPLRVMLSRATELDKIVAVLHDAVEDGPPGILGVIYSEFGPEVGDAVDAVSRRPGESYRAYIERVKQNQVARTVKRADLLDNLTESRMGKLPSTDRDSLRKRYWWALAQLG